MCIQDVVLYPEIGLRKTAQNVSDVNDSDVINVIDSLLKTMDRYSHCVGLAANQIGSGLNIFVANASKNPRGNSDYGSVVVINPIILDLAGSDTKREGCMSVPDLTGNVQRALNAVIQGFNRQGELVRYEINDFEARVFQHEIDHLNGKVFLDRVKSSRDVHVRKQYRS